MEKFLGLKELLDYGLYLRGIFITIFAMFLFRVNSARLYGSHTPLDFVIYIILGAILGEAIVNNIPVLPSIIVCIIIVSLYRLLSFLTYKSHKIGKYIKGETIEIVKNGKYIQKNMKCCRITPHDIQQALRLNHSLEDISLVKKAILERGGQISFIFKN